MSDPIPREGGIENPGANTDAETDVAAEAGRHVVAPLPPTDLPEELVLRRLARLDTRRTLAELCKNIPGLDEALLPRGIQADALTRKSGGSSTILKGVSRRVLNDAAAWGAFRTAVGEQVPPETYDALENIDPENLEDRRACPHHRGAPARGPHRRGRARRGGRGALISAWREENQKAEKQAAGDARIADLEGQLERLKRENERLSFASRAANERAASLGREVDVLRGEREDALAGSKRPRSGRRRRSTCAAGWARRSPTGAAEAASGAQPRRRARRVRVGGRAP
jgi:hypothetical protein